MIVEKTDLLYLRRDVFSVAYISVMALYSGVLKFEYRWYLVVFGPLCPKKRFEGHSSYKVFE